MRLRMDDLHTPTVASGPTTNGASHGTYGDRLTLRELIHEKDRVEAELLALSGVLDSHGVKMDTPLTTQDGFPRSDIDVAQIRTTRARVIRLKNDYKDLMGKIEKGLHEHHANGQAQSSQTAPAQSSSSLGQSDRDNVSTSNTPFAKVNSVVAGSPAETAGLQAGDQVVTFGLADWMNHERLSKVAQVVSQNEGRQISVLVVRSSPASATMQTHRLNLVPRRDWGGRGLLGCHLVQL